mgnify:FL=1|jgi:hypothetical protein
MSTQTPNLNLDLREGTDIFNPLSTNANFETLDSVITEIRKKGGVPTYTTTASANLLKLSENPVPNETLFKFVAAGDANTWSFQETVNNIVTLDGKQKTVKGGEMYVAWVNAANAMVVIAWPDVVNAQTFDGKGPAEWASKAQLDAVNQTAVNATTTAQAAATVANNALEAAQKAGMKLTKVWTRATESGAFTVTLTNTPENTKLFLIRFLSRISTERTVRGGTVVIPLNLYTNEHETMMIWDRTDESAQPCMYLREISNITTDAIRFERGNRYSSFSSVAGDDMAAIPVEIYALS